MSNKPSVSTILNCYRRPHSLKTQYEAVKSQTIHSEEIMIWKNHPLDSTQFDFSEINDSAISINNANYGVWARFAFALNSNSDYICVIDDDTIPGPRWYQNCINSIEHEQNGLYGTVGVVFHDLDYKNFTRHGWPNPNSETKRADIVGHAWFFHRDLLSAFWREVDVPLSRICGEDMHFSYSIQKYLNLNTYVPPHPSDDLSLWGSQPSSAYKYGVDDNAISVECSGKSTFGESLTKYYNKGFKLLDIPQTVESQSSKVLAAPSCS
ncbi:MAG: glycosyltransferase [Proteobacteria bacterium]|nr:glycosyltransferase [Pseudomonadota bacterium]|tara:strand:+ start:279 stop:1076 length:798 start_codon:yes stop_codon:yes gene_type:complete